MSLLALTAGIQDTDVGLDFFPALVLQVDSGVPGVQRQCREYGSDISQDELTYPGQVKITVIRETRSVAFAK